MRTLVVLAALVGFVSAGGGASYQPTQQVLDQAVDSEPTNYNFAFAADSHSRSESREGNVVRGQYSLLGADGISRIVHYIADAYGFRASVSTNEPGTESLSPADVALESSQPPAKELAELYGPSYVAAPSVSIPAAPVLSQTHYGTKGGYVAQAPLPVAPVAFKPILPAAAVIPQAPIVHAPHTLPVAPVPVGPNFGIRIQHGSPVAPVPVPLSTPLLPSSPVFSKPVLHSSGVKGYQPAVKGAVKSPVKRLVMTKSPPPPPPAATKTLQPPVKTALKKVVVRPLIPIPALPAIRTIPAPTTTSWMEPIVHEQQKIAQEEQHQESQEEEPQQQEHSQEQSPPLLNSFSSLSDEQPDQWSGSS